MSNLGQDSAFFAGAVSSLEHSWDWTDDLIKLSSVVRSFEGLSWTSTAITRAAHYLGAGMTQFCHYHQSARSERAASPIGRQNPKRKGSPKQSGGRPTTTP